MCICRFLFYVYFVTTAPENLKIVETRKNPFTQPATLFIFCMLPSFWNILKSAAKYSTLRISYIFRSVSNVHSAHRRSHTLMGEIILYVCRNLLFWFHRRFFFSRSFVFIPHRSQYQPNRYTISSWFFPFCFFSYLSLFTRIYATITSIAVVTQLSHDAIH